MAFYGDRYVNIWTRPERSLLDMSTAIITANTPQGFFLAADGRRRKEGHGICAVLSDTQQKVFEIRDDRARFAFAVTGTAAFSADSDDDIIFDFTEAIPRVAADLRTTVRADATDYCQRLVKDVNKILRSSIIAAETQGKAVTRPSNPDPQNLGHSMIAMLFICGYYSESSCHILFKFFHRNGEIAAPLTCHMFQVGENSSSGSVVVGNLLYKTKDHKFAKFRHPVKSSMTFLEWAAIAKDYVAACESPDGRAADPDFASGIGGHVHAATVTLADGFKWIPGFEPIVA